jgi:hypothetical protein
MFPVGMVRPGERSNCLKRLCGSSPTGIAILFELHIQADKPQLIRNQNRHADSTNFEDDVTVFFGNPTHKRMCAVGVAGTE